MYNQNTIQQELFLIKNHLAVSVPNSNFNLDTVTAELPKTTDSVMGS